jgi:hypothetical protein
MDSLPFCSSLIFPRDWVIRHRIRLLIVLACKHPARENDRQINHKPDCEELPMSARKIAVLALALLVVSCISKPKPPNHEKFRSRLEKAGGWRDVKWTGDRVEANRLVGGVLYYFDIAITNDGNVMERVRAPQFKTDAAVYVRYRKAPPPGIQQGFNHNLLSSLHEKKETDEVKRLADEFWDAYND